MSDLYGALPGDMLMDIVRRHQQDLAAAARPPVRLPRRRRRGAPPAEASPVLVIVSGPPGSGKTTLAHALAHGLRCPAICRDEIKEGMVHAVRREAIPGERDPLNPPTNAAFFETLRVLLGARVTLVAEAAFQDRLWRSGLNTLTDLAAVRVVHCEVDPGVARERVARRLAAAERAPAAHGDAALLRALAAGTSWTSAFQSVSIAAPVLHVDTTAGYDPCLAAILAFVNRR